MNFPEPIQKRIKQVTELCIKHKVLRLYAFGSILRNDFNSQSDIDLQAEFDEMPPIDKGEHILELWDELEKLFGRKVDLLTNSKIQNPYLKEQVDLTKKLIYEYRNEKISV